MTSSKEMQQFSRPLTYHRSPLTNSSATGLLGRQAHARTNSHCLLTGSLNTNHRVTRRKSVTNTGPNVAAFTAAALNVAAAKGESSAALPIAAGDRRHPMSKARVYSLPSPPASFPIHRSVPESKESAIDDEAIELSDDEGSAKDQKAHVRRASDGQPLLKDGKKSNRIEVRCEKCGKGYKHSSCLTKHLWEHTPGWSYTSKLLISKHQQVQLLEAASVLVAMNGKESSVTPPDSTKDSASELDSSSPAGSGYSEADEGQGSADTTPPPAISFGASPYRDTRLGVAGDVSDNRQSTSLKSSLLTETGFAGTVLGLGDRRQTSFERRPPSSGANRTGQDDRDLAAAVELLSCSFGSNNGSNGTLTLPIDAPPVPPVPAQYLDQATFLASTGFFNSFPSRQPESFTRGELQQSSIDVKMEDSGEDDDFDMQSHARSDEDDGIFGRMEE